MLVVIVMILMCCCLRGKSNPKMIKPTNTVHELPYKPVAQKTMFKVYGYMGCPYTVKQLDLMKDNGVDHQFVPTDTKKGGAEFNDLMKGEQSGVPVTLNLTNGKISRGFSQIDEL